MDRSDSFVNDRKMFFCSTPLDSATSHILRIIEWGDKRYYYVYCPRCGVFQPLFFRGHLNNGKYENDRIYNMKFEKDGDGILIAESIYYKCRVCSGKIYEYEKFDMMNAGYWEATKRPINKNYRSYLINGVYSLFTTWENICTKFIEGVKDKKALKTVVNNVFAEGWEDMVYKVEPKNLHTKNRRDYQPLIIPNKTAIADKNGPILAITLAVDVNKGWLAIEMIGHCLNGQVYIIAKAALYGSVDKDGEAWEALQYIVDSAYESDDNVEYEIAITVIDSGHRRDEVFYFCNNNPFCVPIRGVGSISGAKKHTIYEQDGTKLFRVDTIYYKIEMFENLNEEWNGRPQKQPVNFCNFPNDEYIGGFEKLLLGEKFGTAISQDGFNLKFFKTYESEIPVLIDLPNGNQTVKSFKKVKDNNHFFDDHVYNLAAIEIYTHLICNFKEKKQMDKLSMMSELSRFYHDNKSPYLLEEFIF